MDQPDRIHLRDYVVSVEIGAFRSERGHDQRLRFDLTVDLAQPTQGADDRVDAILSYDVLTGAVTRALADRRYDLLETLAEKIAAEVLSHPGAGRVAVTVEKLDRIPGALGVSIERRAGRVAADAGAARPTLLFHASPAPWVSGDVIVADGPARPAAEGHQRMIALLALDQAAWALSARLGLDVVESRTEIDWAIATGRPVIWAPARMVADVPDTPADPLALTFWLARRLDAARIDLALPAGRAVPDPPADLDIPLTLVAPDLPS